MLKYTIAFLKIHEKLLMINRQKAPWQGAWNGVGGKLEPGETPEACVIREIWEETGIVVHDQQFRGIVTWEPDKEPIQGMYVFLAEISVREVMDLPRATREGLLALKDISWILSEDNFGIVPSIRFFLKHMLDETNRPVDYHCVFDGDEIVRTEVRPLHEAVLR